MNELINSDYHHHDFEFNDINESNILINYSYKLNTKTKCQ